MVDKKSIMRKIFLCTLTVFICTIYFGNLKAQTFDRPNIILVIADDVSWDDIGAYGDRSIHTPNIDRLAKDGRRFDNVFLTTSSCSPSRISILTGRYPHNTGAAELHTEVGAEQPLFPLFLKKAGYYTALAGKWHEGPHSALAYDTLLVDKAANGEGGERQWVSLLNSTPKEKPFFLWLASYDAHREWSADSTFRYSYKPNEVKVPKTLVDDSITRRDLASYYNEITRLDDYIGDLLRHLEESSRLDNTIIIFMADNGRPFPGSKTRLTDRGIKTPFIVHWPRGIKLHKPVTALISSIDLSATILDLAHIPVPDAIQGKSFSTLLKDDATDRFREYIFSEHNWHDYEAYERAVRTTEYLYIVNERPQFNNDGPIDANQSPSAHSLKARLLTGGLSKLQQEPYINPRPREEFYDLKRDPEQVQNKIDDPLYRNKLAHFRKVLKKWQNDTGDTLPAVLTNDWYDRGDGQPLRDKGKRGEMPGRTTDARTTKNKGSFQ